eukprot:73198-Alexandrium_andersonii.AAC.1
MGRVVGAAQAHRERRADRPARRPTRRTVQRSPLRPAGRVVQRGDCPSVGAPEADLRLDPATERHRQ